MQIPDDDTPLAVYRIYEAVTDELVYVGMSTCPERRVPGGQHWKPGRRFTEEWFPDYDQAYAAETIAINMERPKRNISKVIDHYWPRSPAGLGASDVDMTGSEAPGYASALLGNPAGAAYVRYRRLLDFGGIPVALEADWVDVRPRRAWPLWEDLALVRRPLAAEEADLLGCPPLALADTLLVVTSGAYRGVAGMYEKILHPAEHAGDRPLTALERLAAAEAEIASLRADVERLKRRRPGPRAPERDSGE